MTKGIEWKIGFFIVLALCIIQTGCATYGPGQPTDPVYCKIYADTALQQAKQRSVSGEQVPEKDPVWSGKYYEHYFWCLLVSKESCEEEERVRQEWLETNLPPGYVQAEPGAWGPQTEQGLETGSQNWETQDQGTGFDEYCRSYADIAVQQVIEAMQYAGYVPSDYPTWANDWYVHYNWCMSSAQEGQCESEIQVRQKWVGTALASKPSEPPSPPSSDSGSDQPPPAATSTTPKAPLDWKKAFGPRVATKTLNPNFTTPPQPGSPAPSTSASGTGAAQTPATPSTPKPTVDWKKIFGPHVAAKTPNPLITKPPQVASTPSASKDPYCRRYADTAMQQIRKRKEMGAAIPASDSRWKDDWNFHFGWCMNSAQTAQCEQETRARQSWLDSQQKTTTKPPLQIKPGLIRK